MKRDVHAGIQNQEWHEHQDHKHWHWRILILAVIVSVAAAGTSVKIASNKEQKAAWGLTLNAAKAQTLTCNVLDYGANGSDNHSDTDAINHAISDCFNKGGGTVEFPQGTYIIGRGNGSPRGGLLIKGNITLKLNNATIKGADDFYGTIIFADHADNIAIEGPGTVDRGKGGHSDGYWVHSITLDWCQGVNLKNFTIFSDSEDYNDLYGYHLVTSGCQDVVYDNVTVLANKRIGSYEGANDSLHFTNGGKNIRLINSEVVGGDDTLIFQGTEVGFPEDHDYDDVLIQNVDITGYLPSAAITFTTGENSNTNMTFDNIRIHDSLNPWGGTGIWFLPRDRNVYYNNITFSNIVMDGKTATPIKGIDPWGNNDISGLSANNMTFRNFDIYRVNNDLDYPSEIHNMDNVIFENITYYYSAGQNIPGKLVYFREINGLCINNFKIMQGGNEIPNPNSYLSIASDVNGVSFDQPCQFNGCNCTAWQDLSCGGGSCQPSQLCQTRTCDPAGCDNESRCISDPSCGVSEDINLDGRIDILDLQLAINVLLGLEKDNAIIARADVNRDGQINHLDLQQIANRVLLTR